MANVTYQREDFIKAGPRWALVCDACEGESAVKAMGDAYLPRPNPTDRSEQNKERFKQYLARAVYYNATGRTLAGLIGTSFKRAPVISLPVSLEYLSADADGRGVTLQQQAKNTLSAVLKKGRHALWVDYPNTEVSASVADLASRAVQASIIPVNANQVINWRVDRVGTKSVLSLVVIREQEEVVSDDGFGIEAADQYRVLRIIEGRYTVEIHRMTDGAWSIHEEYTPTNGAGAPWTEIPFTFIGSQDNDPAIDTAPLYDLAVINLAHYRNSADYEDSAYFTGQAQAWISGLSEDWRDWLEANGLYVGSRTPILLPEGGRFGMEQAQPNTMVHEAMGQKEEQMVALGARLVQKGQAIKTATQAQGELEAEHSVLSLVVDNVSSAYATALAWAGEFMNAPGDIEFELNTDFASGEMDAQTLLATLQTFLAGTLPRSDLFQAYRRAGLVDPEKTDEEIDEELESSPMGLALEDV